MKIRLTKGMIANDSLIDYFGRGPEADGYSIEKEATFCALPKISEYRRSGVAGSPLLHRVLQVKKSNATKEEKEQFNLSFSNLLRLGAINGGKKELPFNRSIEFWDFVIDVPKHVTILGFVLGRVDVLQLVDNLRSELLCDLLKELRVKPKVDERVIDILQPPQQNYLIEFLRWPRSLDS